MGKELILDPTIMTRNVAVKPHCSSAQPTLDTVGYPEQAMHAVVKTEAAVLTPPPDINKLVKVHVSKDYMKFNAAHFIAYKGFREKLHGHNYRCAVTITGQVGSDGYVVDFGEIKRISRIICKDLNESFLVPMKSDVMEISFNGPNIHITTEDMATFSFPQADCSLLPIVHSSAEELAMYISDQLVDKFTLEALLNRGVRKLEVTISEADQQFASYERAIGARSA
ncbi:hypothetical protein V7S43_007315 [Phytophthora oleae]|uniref:6-pyruvoyltetrahydropterin synthase n=1 Tax=Phytophthora oleae TaxID=2107226 RepID=A0ABD3FPI7_9STRA